MVTIEVAKEFVFHAAHKHTTANVDDPCGRLHGHSYRLVLLVKGEMGEGDPMLMHGDSLKRAYAAAIEPHVEHQYLNETLPLGNPTMEQTALWIKREVTDYFLGNGNIVVVEVTLWETPTMSCSV